MRLDLLQNPRIRSDLNAYLFLRQTENISPIDKNSFVKNQKDLKSLSAYFGGESGGNFAFLSGDFVELFLRLGDMKIGFALSNHQQAYQAYQAYQIAQSKCDLIPIVPDRSSGIILDLPFCDVYILPYINQDLLTRNPIKELKERILSSHPESLLIIDVSYALARGEILDFGIDSQTIFLCDGESLGFLRGYGVFLGLDKHMRFFAPTRYIDGFYAMFLQEIQALSKKPKMQDQKEVFFDALKEILQNNVELFAPLASCIPNALPLRLKGIKARNLLQSLFLEKIFAINGQDCLFGFQSPSFVLRAMGYTESTSRELLSLSFDAFDRSIAQKIAFHYQNIKELEV